MEQQGLSGDHPVIIQDLLGIEYPLIAGAMANISTPEFAAAISNAGALGMIASGGMSLAQARQAIHTARTLTDRPFGVNVMMMRPDVEDFMNMIVEEKPAVVTLGAGNPGVYMKRLKEAGIIVIPVVSSAALARRLERAGADALIAEGMEAGGHIGDVTTMALVPQIVDAVKIPVIAAGGIGDSRGVKAALCLGASGVQVGTCMIATAECPVHENYKQAVLQAKDRSTTITGSSLNSPVRVAKNAMSRQYLKLEHEMADRLALEALTLGSLRKAVYEGDMENGSVMMGQIAGLCHDIVPVKERIEGLMHPAGFFNLQPKAEGAVCA